jgi:hypothetical protein
MIELQSVCSEMQWSGPQGLPVHLKDALDCFDYPDVYRVALPCWWGTDSDPLFAGMDWIELLAVNDASVRVNRVIERGARERVETLPLDTPVIVFKFNEDKTTCTK